MGHLFLESCSRTGPNNHNHVLQPKYSWYPSGWLSHDPFSGVDTAPFFYAPDIVDEVLSASPCHEIASHTFTHAILGDPECGKDVAYSQLKECKRLAAERGIDQVSLVFPRNSTGHFEVLCELGFTCFRGVERNWYRSIGSNGTVRRLCHFMDRLAAMTPPCYREITCFKCPGTAAWLVELPASMFYVPSNGIWNLLSVSRRVLQAKRGIEAAVKKKALFHLWFHPFNLATSPRLIDGLEEILAFAADYTDSGELTNMTMAEAAACFSGLLQKGGWSRNQ